jgi:response regulator NasT
METQRPPTLEACHRLIDQLYDALVSRDVIGQAKGILMAAEGFSDEEAFLVLVRASQRENKKLRDVAVDVVAANAARVAERRG